MCLEITMGINILWAMLARNLQKIKQASILGGSSNFGSNYVSYKLSNNKHTDQRHTQERATMDFFIIMYITHCSKLINKY